MVRFSRIVLWVALRLAGQREVRVTPARPGSMLWLSVRLAVAPTLLLAVLALVVVLALRAFM
jgi:hypothetical protein